MWGLGSFLEPGFPRVQASVRVAGLEWSMARDARGDLPYEMEI